MSHFFRTVKFVFLTVKYVFHTVKSVFLTVKSVCLNKFTCYGCRGTAVDLVTREFKQYTYLDQTEEPEDGAAPFVVTFPTSPSELEMILNTGLFTFLLSS